MIGGRAGALLAPSPEPEDDDPPPPPSGDEEEILELTLRLPPGTRLGVRLSPAAEVEAILEPSPAASAGLQRGDVLIEVDGKELSDEYSAVDAFKAATDENHTLKVRRRAGWAKAPPPGPPPGPPPPS